MARVRGVDELLEFLIEKVALCGPAGANKAKLREWVSDFYSSSQDGITSSSTPEPQDTPPPMNVDEDLVISVLGWLDLNSHTYIVRSKARRLAKASTELPAIVNERSTAASDGLELSVEADRSRGNISESPARVNDEESIIEPTIEPVEKGKEADDNVFVYATKDRQWRAITGHGEDYSRLREKEFQILSLIAAHGEDGVLQPELIKLSGQDKRSLPARTDFLHRNGYIEKETVVEVGKKTSLCTLQKFINAAAQRNGSEGEDPSSYFAKIFHPKNELFRPLRFLDVAVTFLKRVGVVEGEAFSNAMGVDIKSKQNRPIRRYLQHMAKIGSIELLDSKRRIQFPSSKLPAKYLKFIRDPSKKARESFGTFANPKGDIDIDDAEDDFETGQRNDNSDLLDEAHIDHDADDETAEEPKDFPSDRIPQLEWDPDRPMPSQIADFVEKSGADGATSTDISERLVGSFWRAPLEHLFGHLTDNWQESQPLHLRHLAIIRDTAQSGRASHYVYRTYKSFSTAVKRGDANWEAVIDPRIAVQRKDDPAGTSAGVPLEVSDFPTLEQTYGRKRARPPLKQAAKSPGKAARKRDAENPDSTDPNETQTEEPARKRARSETHQTPMSETNLDDTAIAEGYCSLSAASPKFSRGEIPPEGRRRKRQTSTDRNNEIANKRAKMGNLPPGVHINPLTRVREQQCRRGRRPKSKLAVFRSDLLHGLDWFDKTTLDFTNSAYWKPANTRTEMLTQANEPATLVNRPSAAKGVVEQEDSSRKEAVLHQNVSLKQDNALPLANVSNRDVSLSGVDAIEPKKSNAATELAPQSGGELFSVEDHDNPDVEEIEPPDPPASDVSRPEAMQAHTPSSRSKIVPSKPFINRSESVWKRAGVQLGKGSKDYRRSKVILRILEQAGGVFPGHKEMWFPFVTEMRKADPDYKPDIVTVNRAVANVVHTGKLKRQTFAFKDSKGVARTRDVLFLPHISPDSEKLRALQGQIAEKYPLLHLPDNIDIDAALMPSNAAVPNQENPETGKKYVSTRRLQNTNPHGYAKGIPAWQSWANLNSGKAQGSFNLPKTKPQDLAWEYFDSDEDDTASVAEGQMEQQSEWQLSNYTPRTYEMPVKRPHAPISKRLSLQPPKIVTESMSPRHSKDPPITPKASRPVRADSAKSSKEPDLRRQLMGPTQQFYPNTGTFSTLLHSGKTSRPSLKIQPDLAREFDNRMPHSIEDIINNQPMVGRAGRKRAVDNRIESEIDKVMDWEHKNSTQLSTMQLGEIRWINHSFSSEEASRVQWLTPDPPSIIPHVPGYRHILPSVRTADQPDIPRAVPFKTGSLQSRPPIRAPVAAPRVTPLRSASNSSIQVTKSYGSQVGRTRGKPNSQSSPQEQGSPSPQVTRGRKLVNLYTNVEIKRLITAVTVARTLTGGIEKAIDWHIVKKMCPHIQDRDDHYLMVKWTQAKRIYRTQIDKLEADFQRAYLKAYEEGDVPPIDFDEPESYDWSAVAEWVEKDMKIPKFESVRQPPAKSDENYSYKEDNVYEFPYEELYKTTTTSLRRMELLKDLPFSLPLRPQKSHAKEHDEDGDLGAVKSHVLANVITPQTSYDPTAAAAKLKLLGEERVGDALDQLRKSNILRHANKGRALPGRNFILTDHFYRPFRTASRPMSTMFQSAARYKQSLDEHFDTHGQAQHSYHATNGEMLALYNLVANRRVSVEILLPPYTTDPSINPIITDDTSLTMPDDNRVLSVWGFTHGNYQTMKMNKENIIFPLRLLPTSEYVGGLPVLEQMPPPPMESPAQKGSCLWSDINSQLVPSKWTMVLASVLNLIAFRSGITVELVAKNLGSVLQRDDISLVSSWLNKAGLVQGNRLEPKEWFWGVFGAAEKDDTVPEQDDIWQED